MKRNHRVVACVSGLLGHIALQAPGCQPVVVVVGGYLLRWCWSQPPHTEAPSGGWRWVRQVALVFRWCWTGWCGSQYRRWRPSGRNLRAGKGSHDTKSKCTQPDTPPQSKNIPALRSERRCPVSRRTQDGCTVREVNQSHPDHPATTHPPPLHAAHIGEAV